ncbi:MAG: RsmE family RNA methyltransferase, partial [Alphaproteobacteria bacterium]|nr:RsmE family RNA methyltransferase [Alphaproteobacteria bacterium]
GEFLCEISDIHKKGVDICVLKQIRKAEQCPQLHLAFAPIKNDRLHFMIEKATELGVTILQPVITQHTIVHRVNVDKLIRIAIEASEQCERLCIPKVLEPLKLVDYIQSLENPKTIAWAWERMETKDLNTKQSPDHPTPLTGLFIGPEGGFSQDEVSLLQNHCTPISLGQNILRAETAAIVGLDRLRQKLTDSII